MNEHIANSAMGLYTTFSRFSLSHFIIQLTGVI